MGYAETEESVKSGLPIELVAFVMGSQSWRYAMCAYNVSYGGETYFAAPHLSRTEIEDSPNVLRTQVDFIASWFCPFVQQYHAEPPDGVVAVTNYRGHDPDYVVQWQGFVLGVELEDKPKARISCTSALSDVLGGIALRCGRQCQVPIYSGLCGLTKASWAVPGSVDSVSGDVVVSTTLATQANGWWVGGPFEALERSRLVVAHSGTSVTLSSPINGLAAGHSYLIYPGCDHLPATCQDKLDNYVNYQGQPTIPDRSPWREGVV